MKMRFFGLVLAIISLSFSTVYAQDSSKCTRTNKKIKNVVWERVFEISANEYYGNVIIRPKDVTPQFLISLSRSLRARYCLADSLVINIYDNKGSLNHGWEIYNRDEKVVRERGIYTFDRRSDREFIRYSTGAGLPLSETIDLSLKVEK